MQTLNLTEAAAVLKVHENRVMEWASTGIIPAAKLGRAWVFIDEDLIAFVKKQIKEQTSTRAVPRDRYRAGSRISLTSVDHDDPLPC